MLGGREVVRWEGGGVMVRVLGGREGGVMVRGEGEDE